VIVPMKKASVVVLDKYREESLRKLREIGVVHLEKKSVSSGTLTELLERKAGIESALGILRGAEVAARAAAKAGAVKAGGKARPRADASPDAAAGEDPARLVLELGAERKTIHERMSALAREQSRIGGWGSFNPADLDYLAHNGINFRLYEFSTRVFAALPQDIPFIVINKTKTTIRAAVLDREVKGAHLFLPGEYSLSEIEKILSDLKARLAGIEEQLVSLLPLKPCILDRQQTLLRDIEFETAKTGMGMLKDAPPDITVSWITGYVPQKDLGHLKRAAAENNWALLSDDPSPADKPPTLMKDNAFFRIIHPLFGFLGIVPGYREQDISPSFLVFFCLFFAMIYGDAAYGVLIFIAVLALGFFVRKKTGVFPDVLKLFMLLSFCVIVWGSVTGSWFAVPKDTLPGFLRILIIPPFNDSGPLAAFPSFLAGLFKIPAPPPADDLKTRWNLEFLCFTVGVVQLVWARSKNIKNQLPSLTAVAQLGWLILMLGLYFLVLFMILGVKMPAFTVWFIGAGLGLYFIFAEQKGGNFFGNILTSFTNFLPTFLTAVGSFADIISYIRLFAVGLAGAAIAGSFNTMSMDIASGFAGPAAAVILKLFGAVVVLVFGHSLNMAMNALSVLVHGVRLNLLEYAGNHLGMEWTGYSYKPFALGQKKNNK